LGGGLPVFLAFLAGCSSPQTDEPTPREVRKHLMQQLESNSLHLAAFHQEEEGHYLGEASDSKGNKYRLDVTLEGRAMTWHASQPDVILSGRMTLPEPTFTERHRDLVQGLRAVVCVINSLAVVWALLGPLGFRRRYSPATERIVTIVGAINLGLAMFVGYQFYLNLNPG
jgi:hypothetical protein